MNRSLRKALRAVGLGKREDVSIEGLQTQYYRRCADAGELQYRIGQFQQELKDINSEIFKLSVALSEVLTQKRAEAGSHQEGAGAASAPASPPQEEE